MAAPPVTILQDGRVRYSAAERAIIAVGSGDAHHALCQILFNRRDGSIHVLFPYLVAGPGVVSAVTLPEQASGPLTLDLGLHGKVSSWNVKYSHHQDGLALFSESGRVFSIIRRHSFPLASTIGHVFQFHAYHPAGFEALDPKAPRDPKRAYCWSLFAGGLPKAVTVRGQWRRKQDIERSIDLPDGVAGPVTDVIDRSTGQSSKTFFVGQPVGWPLREHVLMVSVDQAPVLDNITAPAMVFIGGWDPHEVPDISTPPVHQTGCLAFLYPHESAETLAARLGSIDFMPGAVTRKGPAVDCSTPPGDRLDRGGATQEAS